MKSEQEIRQHRDDLRLMRQQPCGCRGSKHADQCRHGAMMMFAAERALSWLLGECLDYDRIVAGMRKDGQDKQLYPGLG